MSTEQAVPGSDSLRTVHERTNTRGLLRVLENIDKTAVYLHLEPADGSDRPEYGADALREVLATLAIQHGILADAVETATAGSSEPVLVARATPAEPGADSYLERLFDPDDPVVEAKQALIRVVPPTDGKPGQTVYGDELLPVPGRAITVHTGPHTFSDDSVTYASEIFGRAHLDGTHIWVDPIITVDISDDRLQAAINITDAKKISRDHILQALYARHITSGIDQEAIDFIVSSYNSSGKPVKGFTVARGSECVPGRDAMITYRFDSSTKPHFTEHDDGSIDIRETNLVQSIREGEELAVITPHVDPQNGKDVFGNVIRAEPIKKATLRAGQNVTVSDDQNRFFAKVSGRPLLEKTSRGTIVSVNPVLRVDHDLDLSIGNIDFDGAVEINGYIEDGFSVKAAKQLIVSGGIGACTLESEGDIVIQGGCNGKEQARITCGGNLQVKFINESTVICRGDVLVRNEIVNSRIDALGRVLVPPQGSIRGGRISAKMGIECYDIGSEMGVKTVLEPGADYELAAQCERIDEKIIGLNNELTTLSTRIAPLLKNKEVLAGLPAEQRAKLKETVDYLQQLRTDKDTLNNEKNSLIETARASAKPEVCVRRYVYNGVLLKIGDSRREISSRIEGPLRLYEEHEQVTVEPWSLTTRKP